MHVPPHPVILLLDSNEAERHHLPPSTSRIQRRGTFSTPGQKRVLVCAISGIVTDQPGPQMLGVLHAQQPGGRRR